MRKRDVQGLRPLGAFLMSRALKVHPLLRLCWRADSASTLEDLDPLGPIDVSGTLGKHVIFISEGVLFL